MKKEKEIKWNYFILGFFIGMTFALSVRSWLEIILN